MKRRLVDKNLRRFLLCCSEEPKHTFAHSSKMKIKVKTLRGQLYTLDVPAGKENVDDTKAILQDIIKVPTTQQKFVYKGKLLKTGPLADWGVKEGDFLVVIPHIIPKAATPPEESPKPKETTPSASSLSASQKIEKPASKLRESGTFVMPPVATSEPQVPPVPISPPSSTATASATTATTTAVPATPLTDAVTNLTSQLQDFVNSLTSAVSSAPPPPAQSSSGAPVDINAVLEMDPVALQQLQDMGFGEEAAKKALLLCRMNSNLAMEWLLEHTDDPDLNTPLSQQQLQQIANQEASFQPDDFAKQQLINMGFPESEVVKALRITRNNYEAAAAWLLGDRDLNEDDEEEEDAIHLDANNPLVQAILNNPAVQSALGNPRVVQALKSLIDDPSSASQYVDDPEIGPVLMQVHNILQTQGHQEGEEVEGEEEESMEDEEVEVNDEDEEEEDEEQL